MNAILNFVLECVSSISKSTLFTSCIIPILTLTIIIMSIEVIKNICTNL